MKSNEELLKIIESHEQYGIGGDTGELANDRALALDRYFGREYGNELEGRSRVVSKDISDAVDWIMPQLMRIFLSTDDICRFDPVGPEDEKGAEQETDYVNHVIMRENPGFTILHDWFKDSLLLKNGYVKRWWDETEEVTHESYSGLAEEELYLLISEIESGGDEVEIVGQEESMSEMGFPVYEVKLKRTNKRGGVVIEPIPPEEIVISSRARTNLQESTFVAHITTKTRSELIEMGMDEKFVESLPAWADAQDEESYSRDTLSDEADWGNRDADKSTEEVEYKECYVRVDADDDGIAELRCIIVVGNKIPDGEDWNKEIDDIPLSYLTPNRLPHRHIGLSLYDELKEIAEIKTALIRGALDNTYQLTNSEWLVNERVNLSDFLQSRPNGIKRIMDKMPIGDAASPVQKPSIVQHVIPVLDYMDQMKETRTGVGRNMMGLDQETLRKTTEGAARQALQQANSKIEMIARLFAETGVKDLALAVHALLIKNQDKPKVIKLRNEWVQINPQEWKTRYDMTVSVGLGTGSQDEVRSNLLLLADLQERAAVAGIVLPRNVYNLANKSAQMLGFKTEGEFFSDPDGPEVQQRNQPQEQPNPLAEAEQIKGMVAVERDRMKHESDQVKQAFEAYKFEQEHALKIAVEEIKAMVEGLKVDIGQPGIGAEMEGSQNGNMDEQLEKAMMLQQIMGQNAEMMRGIMQGMSQPVQIVRDENGNITGATRG